jgi:hypothetical protein
MPTTGKAVSRPTTLSAGDLRVEFVRGADRYRHAIVEGAAEPTRPLLSSIEGLADDDWPASPPLQELHVEKRGEGRKVALLVGRAGHSHWSLSVEVDGSQQTLLFDVACRSLAASDGLSSSYRLVEAGFAASLPASDRVALSSKFDLHVLEGELQVAGADKRILRIAPPLESTAGGKILTFRWRYRIAPTQR